MKNIVYKRYFVKNTSVLLLSAEKILTVADLKVFKHEVINSCIAPVLFFQELIFSAPIVTLLAFCNLCAVTDGKKFFSVTL